MDALIPVEGEALPISNASKAEQYIQNKAWSYRITNNQFNVEVCPLCKKDNWHFFIGTGDKDGLWDCKRCGERGNLYQLATKLGDKLTDILSLKEWGGNNKTDIDPIPNIHKFHEDLLLDGDVLDYLFCERGFTMDAIKWAQLGVKTENGGKWLVIPYFNNGQPVFVKYRTLPPAAKDFRATRGRDVPLYNQDCLKPNMEELLFAEGETDCISLISNGILNTVGVPGAGVQKTMWVERIDNLKPKKIYLVYDNDQAGQKAAQEMAIKLGIEKCYNILLPDFPHPFDLSKKGKDINEWFMAGHTKADFEVLMAQARPFDVAGVQGIGAALDELEAELEAKGGVLNPTFVSPWEELNKRLGGGEPGDVIGIMAEGKVGKTTMLLNWLDFYANKGIPALLYCQEMPTKRLARKWASYVTKTDDNPYSSKLTAQTIRDAKTLAGSYPADLLLGYTRGHKPDHIFDVIRQAVRRYGVRVVGFDNLQLLSRSISNQQAELNVLGKKFKELAMELNILIILIIQPNRVKDGDVVAARNASGSSAIEKDVDAMICLHRNRIAKMKESELDVCISTEETFEPQMNVNVDLCRYGTGGKCWLMMEGNMSWIRNYEASELPSEPKIIGGMVPVEGVEV
jgi:replicative DNA helicase